MNDTESSRRKFLAGSAGGISAAWIAASWPAAAAAAEAAQKSGGFAFFSKPEALEIDAMAAQIFPTTDTPGAREAQSVYFVDLALVTFAQDKQAIYKQGFGELQAKTKDMFPSAASFSALNNDQQVQLLTAIETTPFFKTVRDHTIMGVFAAPQHGGNFQKVGWKLIEFDDSLNFKAPFGAYGA
ncbi:MAG TPA: gluconate 2-dehydrogenase subunit 3 family protein [Rhizomicrobium sp.]|nr:gluconate 2-dehydrogenase subunit 3 family protein [Rhizomicrobium sp.]